MVILAVDLLLLLSGYVIGYAYDDRFGKMGLWGFFKRRIVRLHPMVIFGTLFGTLLFFFGDAPSFHLMPQTELWKLLAVTLAGLVLIPLSPWWDLRGWAETYPLNGPCWSLMWEYVANILYALFVRRFSKTMLAIFVVLAGCMTVDVGMNFDMWGVLKAREWAAYTFIGGWGLTGGPALHSGYASALSVLHGAAAFAHRLEDTPARRLLVVLACRGRDIGVAMCGQG